MCDFTKGGGIVRKKAASLLLAAAVMLTGGCVDISNRNAPETPVIATIPTTTSADIPDAPVTANVSTTTSMSSISQVPVITAGTGSEIEEFYSTFDFSDEDYDFLGRCAFVGDSICSGLGHYGIIPMKNVVAQGNIAARNIFDFTFTVDGSELSLVSALVNINPEYVVFSMGINDVNITSEEEFAENYREILSTVSGFLPNAELIVVSITPVAVDSEFTKNENIDSFNEALGRMLEENEKWHFVDASPELKNSENALKTDYSSGDGIHLSPDAYYAVLYQLCRTYLGDNADTTLPEDNELTIE